MHTIETTVFLSYRRLGGSGWALAISKYLAQRGYDVFVDYASIASGDFEQVILENIRTRAHFLVLLTPSAVERINQPGDLLRREVEAALAHRRNIVPLMLEGFDIASPSIAKHLTGALSPLKGYHFVTVPLEYFDAAMDRLMTKHLNVSVNEVLHPASLLAKGAAKSQQQAVRAASPVTAQELTAERWFERAFDAIEIETQIAFYTEAIRLKPGLYHAFGNRAIARGTLGDLKGAIADFTQAISLKPDYAEAFDNRAVSRLSLGDLDGALADHTEAIRLKPDYADAFDNRGVTRQHLGDLDAALADHTEAIRLKPDYAEAFDNRGVTRQHLGDMKGARADHTKAIRLNPDYAVAFAHRGYTRENLGDRDGALADYTEAIRRKPDCDYAFYCRGRLRAIEGHDSGAIADCQKYLDLCRGQRGNYQAEVKALVRKLQEKKKKKKA